MVVDPNTGMPIQEQQEYGLDKVAAHTLAPGRNTTAGAVSGMAANMGIMSPDSFFSKVLDTIPSVSKTTAWNTYRGTRTIGYGARGVDTATSISSTLNPRYLRSMPSMKAMGGRSVESANRFMNPSKYKAGEAYTPFNSLYRMGNWAARRSGAIGMDEAAFSAGTLSRVSASSRIARGKMPTSNVMSFLEQTDKKIADAVYKSARINSTSLSSKEASHLVAMTTQGKVSGRIAGFMSTIQTGRLDIAGAEGAINQIARSSAGNATYEAGSKAAGKFMGDIGITRRAAAKGGFEFGVKAGGAIEKMGIKAGEKAGLKTVGELALKKGGTKLAAKLGTAMALQAVPIVGQVVGALMLADMVIDIGKLGMEGVKSGIDFAKDAVKSYRGSIDKGVMGMGYRDNTVAATSRQRGVMAIQNSRLNARSVLGSEAGAMHAHFG
jgi:hypothetical protein